MSKVAQNKTIGTKSTKTKSRTKEQATAAALLVRPRDVFDELAERRRAESDAHYAARAREAQQERDEAPAWRPSEDKPNGVITLRSLIADAVAGCEGHSADAFADGAMRALADDLDMLFAACHHDEEDLGLSLGDIRQAIWRLSKRAHAIVELSVRFSGAEHIAAKVVAS
jgi:hypothetical protein